MKRTVHQAHENERTKPLSSNDYVLINTEFSGHSSSGCGIAR
jgi:hypothetical protein